MRGSFNLWTEPWVSTRYLGGDERELGLGKLLRDAHLIETVDDPFPTVCYGLYRLQVALVTDIHRFRGADQVREIYNNGRFAPGEIDRYEERYSHLFDVFDREKPFLQTASPAAGVRKHSVSRLFQQIPSGTGATHFSHGLEKDHAWSGRVCARALMAMTPFMASGGAGYSPSVNGAPPWYVLVRGRSLFETLLLNSRGERELGLPAWRDDRPVQPKTERACGKLLEGLTWQPRTVRLIVGEGGTCTHSGARTEVLVREIFFGPGWKARDVEKWTDPHVAYETDAKGRRWTVRPREGRGAWRELAALAKGRKPDWVELSPLRLECFGLRTDKAKVFEWYRESYPLPDRAVREPGLLQQALEYVDECESQLKSSLRRALGGKSKRALSLFEERVKSAFLDDYLAQLEAGGDPDPILFEWHERVKRICTEVMEAEMRRTGVTACL